MTQSRLVCHQVALDVAAGVAGQIAGVGDGAAEASGKYVAQYWIAGVATVVVITAGILGWISTAPYLSNQGLGRTPGIVILPADVDLIERALQVEQELGIAFYANFAVGQWPTAELLRDSKCSSGRR